MVKEFFECITSSAIRIDFPFYSLCFLSCFPVTFQQILFMTVGQVIFPRLRRSIALRAARQRRRASSKSDCPLSRRSLYLRVWAIYALRTLPQDHPLSACQGSSEHSDRSSRSCRGEINRFRDDNLLLYKLPEAHIKIPGRKLNFLFIGVLPPGCRMIYRWKFASRASSRMIPAN